MDNCNKLNLEWIPDAYKTNESIGLQISIAENIENHHLLVKSIALYQHNKADKKSTIYPKNKKSSC